MAATNSESKKISFFKLNGKADKDVIPKFYKVEKINGKWEKTDGYDTITGTFTGAKLKDYTYEGVTKKSFHIELSDPDIICAIDMNHCQCSHSIINSLVNVDRGQEIKIKVYKKTDKDSGKIYAGAFISDFKGDMISWGIDIKSVPKSVLVMLNGRAYIKDGKEVRDDSNVQAFWEGVFMDKIASKFQKVESKDSDIPEAPAPDMPAVPAMDDLPF